MSLFVRVLLVACMVGLAHGVRVLPFERATGLSFVIGSPAVALVTTLVAVPFLRRRKYNREMQAQEYARASRERLELTGEPVTVNGVSATLVAVVMTVVSTLQWLATLLHPHLLNELTAIGLVFVSSIVWLMAIARHGKPLLTITAGGIETSAHGFLAWHDIEAMKLMIRGRYDLYKILNLRVPALADHLSRMHPCSRLLYRLRFGALKYTLSFSLAPSTDLAKALYVEIATRWSNATGRTNDWYRLRGRLEHEFAEVQSALAQLTTPAAQANPQVAAAAAHSEIQHIEQQRWRRARWTQWADWVAAALIVAIVTLSIVVQLR